IGEVDESRASQIVAAVERPIDAPPFEMVLENVGTFPPKGAPRAFWVGVSGGARQLADLQAEIAARVAALGIPLEARSFQPHLTLGRWKTSRSSDRRRALDAARPGVVARTRIDGATLYQSRISSAGPTYTPLARATLSGR